MFDKPITSFKQIEKGLLADNGAKAILGGTYHFQLKEKQFFVQVNLCTGKIFDLPYLVSTN
jgi:hypothetical protein